MYRRFIAAITAASIAITAVSATQVAAGERERDFARIAAGVLGVAIIGKIIHDKNKRDDERNRVVTRHRIDPAPVYRAPRAAPRVDSRHRVEPRPLPRGYGRNDDHGRKHKRNHRRADDKLLPQQCFKSYDTRRGSVLMFGSRCLERNYRYANRLPQQCAQQIRTHRGMRYGYDARCLRGAGYSLARG